MIVRELPWSKPGRFFEIDSCNVVLQTNKDYTYFIIYCHCHESPELHVADIAKIFNVAEYKTIAPFSHKLLHVIETNKTGKIFFESLQRGLEKNKDCISLKICST